jgi:membrane-associated protease RseP (regulator of RpoE activity)
LALDDRGFGAEGATVPYDSSYFTVPVRRAKFQHRWARHLLLLLITVATTTLLGIDHYLSFKSNFGTAAVAFNTRAVLEGLVYSASILGILGAHEMGHYIACRRYDVDATLPFFIPFPSLSGTLGAVIRIREPFPSRTALFDIGVAGPIAGFVALIPVLFLGMLMSSVVQVPAHMEGWSLGEPLLFKLASWMVFGHVPAGYSVNMHPMVFAAWFGMLATAWNLLPFGQLDGGHLTYAVFGNASRHVSIVTVLGAVVMTFISYSWLAMTIMMLAMLLFLGQRHPPVMNEYEPLGQGRKAVAIFAVVMFVVCFMPVPIDVLK